MATPTDPQVKNDAKSLYLSGLAVCEIARRLKKPPSTIYAWVYKCGWMEQKEAVARIVASTTETLAVTKLTRLGVRTRRRLAETVGAQAETLAAQPVTWDTVRDTKSGKGLASTAKTIAETAALVHGWGRDGGSDDIGTEGLDSIEVETVEPAQLPSPDTTTDCGAEQPPQD